MTYGPIRTASAICRAVASPSGGGTRVRDVAPARDDLVAAGAVLGEERWPCETLPRSGCGVGTAGPLPSDAT